MLWPFEYHAPTSVAEVTALLADRGGAALLAGGTDLLVDMRAGRLRPDDVVDIKRVPELGELRIDRGGTSVIGAAVPLNRLIEERAMPFDGVRAAAQSIATYQIRNRATAVGNLCHGSPAADMAPPLLVLGASLRVTGPAGERLVPLRELWKGVKWVDLREGEWATGIEVPPQPEGLRTTFAKKTRIRGHDLAGVNVGAAYDPAGRSLRVAVGACAPTPLLFDLTALLSGARSLEALVPEAVARVSAGLSAICDTRASHGYRHAMVELFVERALRELLAEGGA